MEKVNKKAVPIEKVFHSFYCDKCGEFLGESVENNEGYYQTFGHYEQIVNILPFTRYKSDKTLCLNCRTEFLEKFIKTLEDLGFEKETY